MFVEDESKDLAKATSVLSRAGSKGSSIYGDAPSAIAHLHAVRAGNAPKPEAVIVDLTLRRGSGQDVLSELQTHRELCDIPAIVWTQSIDPVQHKICAALGAWEVLVKSKSGKELLHAINRIRNAKQSH